MIGLPGGRAMGAPEPHVAESLRRLDALRVEISDWAQRRDKLDVRQQFVTQLASLRTTLDSALQRLSAVAADLQPRSAGQAFELCRAFDSQVVTVRRVWRWFADKFDQRDNPLWAKTVGAADEVVWSVYAGVMRAAHDGQVPTPAPLPYLDELNVPEAILRDEPPPDLRSTDYDEALQLLLAKLPIPVVAVGADSRVAPWELALLGHEAGHHLQYDLLPDRQLVASVGRVVAEAAGGGEAGDEWRWWSPELFADLVGLTTMGPASLVALLPLEVGTARHMLNRERGRYPAPLVRIALIAAMADRLGLSVADELREADVSSVGGFIEGKPIPAALQADLARVPDVATALVRYTLPGHDTMAALSDFSATDFEPGGSVWLRADHLVSNDGSQGRGVGVARALVSAGVVAWRHVAAVPDPAERANALKALGDGLVDRIISSAEEETRAAPPQAQEVDVGAKLVGILARGLVP